MDYKDKIRKLLALAKSPEPEEAKLALLKARKLMAEHKLTERDLEEHDTTVIQQEIDETFFIGGLRMAYFPDRSVLMILRRP